MKNPLAFPKRITVELDDTQQEGLTFLANILPHTSDESLLNEAVGEGLLVMLQRARRSREDAAEKGDAPPRAPMKNSLGFPARLPVSWDGKHDLNEIHAREAEHDKEQARMTRELGLAMSADDGDVPGFRPVENYIGVPLQEGLRRGLESLVNAYPEIEEENLYATLLGLGIKKVQEDPKVLAPLKGAQDARPSIATRTASRQRFKAEWKALCNMVANRYR